MAYVIVDSCTKDLHCVEACPVDCIHPKQEEEAFEKVAQLFIQPEDCIDCGACVPACPTNSIYPVDELPEDQKQFVELNAKYYQA